VYRNKDDGGYLLDIQADLLQHLNTRVVVPLLPLGKLKPAQHLNPTFAIDGEPYAMVTQFMAAVPVAVLGAEVASLVAEQSTVIGALDFLFSGV
jgi:toxin CcdB